MKYRVRIEGRTFEAEVGNVDARPIVVMVEGERFEVWPEHLAGGEEEFPAVQEPLAPAPPPVRPAPEPRRAAGGAQAGARSAEQVRAPIPGAIESVAVRPGDRVEAGDPLCVIEAMKMKNIIRASRTGTVDDVLVAPGQHVRHNDLLVRFVE